MERFYAFLQIVATPLPDRSRPYGRKYASKAGILSELKFETESGRVAEAWRVVLLRHQSQRCLSAPIARMGLLTGMIVRVGTDIRSNLDQMVQFFPEYVNHSENLPEIKNFCCQRGGVPTQSFGPIQPMAFFKLQAAVHVRKASVPKHRKAAIFQRNASTRPERWQALDGYGSAKTPQCAGE